MAFKPIFDSRADVTHQPIFIFSARSIHSSEAAKPPSKPGFRITYWGFIISRNSFFLEYGNIPINSSSRAIGTGLCLHKLAISSHCRARIGCSIECTCNFAKSFKTESALLGEYAPLASTLMVSSEAENCLRMASIKLRSVAQFSEPIFSLMHEKPLFNFSAICCCMYSALPIQIRPFVTIEVSPHVNDDGKIIPPPPFSRLSIAVSRPNLMAGNSNNGSSKLNDPLLICIII